MLNLSATLFMLKRQENNISLIVISILKWNFESVCKTLQKVAGADPGGGCRGCASTPLPPPEMKLSSSYVRTHF